MTRRTMGVEELRLLQNTSDLLSSRQSESTADILAVIDEEVPTSSILPLFLDMADAIRDLPVQRLSATLSERICGLRERLAEEHFGWEPVERVEPEPVHPEVDLLPEQAGALTRQFPDAIAWILDHRDRVSDLLDEVGK